MKKGSKQFLFEGHCNLCGKNNLLIPFSIPKDINNPSKDEFALITICQDCAKKIGFECPEDLQAMINKYNNSKKENNIKEFKDIRKEENSLICDNCNKESLDLEYFIDMNGEEKRLCPKCIEKEENKFKNLELKEIKKKLKKPTEIIAELDKYVIGQDTVKRKLATEVYKHYNSLVHKNSKIEKNNILLTGPSGTGKTYTIKKLLEFLNIPYVIVSANSFSSTGYKGKDIEDILKSLLLKSKSVYKAQYGVVFIDEIDKIRTNSNSENDVNGRKVQEELLTMIEGQKVAISSDDASFPIEIDTKDILFICGGAFNNIEDIVKKRLKISDKQIGFLNTNTSDEKKQDLKYLRSIINAEDLEKFGLIPEFVGRFPEIYNLLPLDKDNYKSILMKKDGLIDQYKDILKYENKQLIFEDDATDYIAIAATKNFTGARSLKPLLSKVMDDIVFEATKTKIKKDIVITKDIVKNSISVSK